jgi:excisionase family DNA binding protein
MNDNPGISTGQRPSFYTIADVAENLGVSTRTVRRWIDSRQLRAFRMGRLRRIADVDLATFLEANRDGD